MNDERLSDMVSGASWGSYGRRARRVRTTRAARLNTRVSKFNVDDVYFFKDAVSCVR
jgi:hypothetical protein